MIRKVPLSVRSGLLRLLSLLILGFPYLIPQRLLDVLGGLVFGLQPVNIPDYPSIDPFHKSKTGVIQVITGNGGSKRRLIEKYDDNSKSDENSTSSALKRDKAIIVKRKDARDARDAIDARDARDVRDGGEPVPPPSLGSILVGYATNSRWMDNLTVLINLVLILSVLDQTGIHKLISSDNLEYSRVESLSSNSADVIIRHPTPLKQNNHKLEFRPIISTRDDLIPRRSSQSLTLSETEDWSGNVSLEGLSPGTTYEYRLQGVEETIVSNFTTFPDSRISGQSHFKFIHASSPIPYKYPYSPYQLVKPLLLPLFPSTKPQTYPFPRSIIHQWKSYALRQPPWKVLRDWLEDSRERIAWPQVKFGLIGDDIELVGTKRGPMGLMSTDSRRWSRRLLANEDVRKVYENLPLLSSRVHSPSQGNILEPAALSIPQSSFSYGDTHFYRLRRPSVERSARESQDWLADLNDLSKWLASVGERPGFKIILSSIPLNPFFGGQDYVGIWREAVLEKLSQTSNVIVLSESQHGFTSSVLVDKVVEITSPPLTSPPHRPFWSYPSKKSPNVLAGREKPHSLLIKVDGKVLEEIKMVKIDYLIKHFPTQGGAQWNSIELDSTGSMPRAIITSLHDGKVIGRLEVVGKSQAKSRAVGSVADSLGNLLKKLGFGSRRWF